MRRRREAGQAVGEGCRAEDFFARGQPEQARTSSTRTSSSSTTLLTVNMSGTPRASTSTPLSVESPAFVPSSATLNAAAASSSRKRSAPASPPLNPTLIPVAPKTPRTAAEKETTRRLIVVLEQACLETYKHTAPASSAGGRGGKGAGEDKYSLLNCDDHQGVLAKMGRDIAHARPDITHQVSTPSPPSHHNSR